MIEGLKFLTVALAILSGGIAFVQLMLAQGRVAVGYLVVGIVLIAMHIAIEEETKK